MGKILSAYLFPHPPIIIEEIGKGQEQRALKTLEASKKLAKDIKNKKPTTIIIITPNGPLFRDAISISTKKYLQGDFQNFGEKNLKFEFENNLKLVKEIIKKSGIENI